MVTNEVITLKENLEAKRPFLPDEDIADLDRYIAECQRVIDGTASADDIEGVQFLIMQKFDREMEQPIIGRSENGRKT